MEATVAAVAERLDVRRVLTTDSDFVAVRIGRRWDQALELVVPPSAALPQQELKVAAGFSGAGGP